jgi:hypothetical protein
MTTTLGPYARTAEEMRELFEGLPRSEGGCWEWQGGTRNGYGNTSYQGKHVYAHRLAYELFALEQPGKACVLHTCDNRRCCNPRHLFLGSRADNIADMWAKGRQSTGVQRATYGNARLTEEDVREIRWMYATGAGSQREIGEAYGLAQTTVSGIIRRVRWPHLK